MKIEKIDLKKLKLSAKTKSSWLKLSKTMTGGYMMDSFPSNKLNKILAQYSIEDIFNKMNAGYEMSQESLRDEMEDSFNDAEDKSDILKDSEKAENLFEDFRFSLQKDLINSKIIPRGTRL